MVARALYRNQASAFSIPDASSHHQALGRKLTEALADGISQDPMTHAAPLRILTAIGLMAVSRLSKLQSSRLTRLDSAGSVDALTLLIEEFHAKKTPLPDGVSELGLMRTSLVIRSGLDVIDQQEIFGGNKTATTATAANRTAAARAIDDKLRLVAETVYNVLETYAKEPVLRQVVRVAGIESRSGFDQSGPRYTLIDPDNSLVPSTSSSQHALVQSGAMHARAARPMDRMSPPGRS